jgi:anti-sigma factor RsiW
MKNFRDIENLSAYLDGQLSASDEARLEARLKTDPGLVSVMNDLRVARGMLRKLPARKAPRNFTLTRQMVGLKPPMPRSYPLLRLATVFASILFLFSFTATALSPMFSLSSPAPEASMFGMGGGCDGPCGDAAMESAPATEEVPAESAPAVEDPSMQEMAPAATEAPAEAAEDSTRITETPSEKEAAPETAAQPEVQQEAPAFINWTALFLIISIAGGVSLWVMRLTARNKWRSH